jgi:hypothetical protein
MERKGEILYSVLVVLILLPQLVVDMAVDIIMQVVPEVLVEEELILSPPSQQEREQQTKGMPVVQETRGEIMEEGVEEVVLEAPVIQHLDLDLRAQVEMDKVQ